MCIVYSDDTGILYCSPKTTEKSVYIVALRLHFPAEEKNVIYLCKPFNT